MADSVEVYAFPEMTFYLWTGSVSSLAAYVEDVQIQVARSIRKHLYLTTGTPYAGRTQYVETNKDVTMTIGAMYAGVSFYGALASGANISATINFMTSADGNTSMFTIWSAQMPDFNLQGGDGGVFKQKLKIIAPDVSGL